MRVVLVNWARIKDGAAHGGGVNGYCQSIGLELVRRGHEVISLYSGMTYEPDRKGRGVGECTIRRLSDWQGIATYEVINSPVLAPSMAQFKEPAGELSAPALERQVRNLFRELRPDVVHFHNIEGLSAGCVTEAIRAGARVIYSLHNYHTICPQVYLMQGHRRACFNFDNGHACATCIPSVNPADEKLRLAGLREGPPAMPVPQSTTPRPSPHPWTTPEIPAYRPLLNIIQPEPVSERPPNDYALRRRGMIDMLNSCHRVLAVSSFVRDKFVSLGLRPEVARMIRIGSRMTELVGGSKGQPGACSLPPPMTPDRPIRIAFVGYNNWYKGLPMLADSLELLVPEILRRFDVSILALNGEHMEPQFRKLEPNLAALRMVHGYRYEDLPRLLSGIDLGIVTSVWWDNAPQTVMEFQACGIPVLGAELGGIPEFVRNGENGVLFRGNDRWDLARRLADLARHPGRIELLRAGVKPPKTVAEHVVELEGEYQDGISSRPS